MARQDRGQGRRPTQLRSTILARALDVGAWTGLLVSLSVVVQVLWESRWGLSLGTDSLIYHVTLPVRWLQEGYLAPVDLPFHDSAAEHSPMLSQSIIYLLMRWTGDDGLAWMVQPAFLFWMYWVFYRSTRLAGAGRRLALVATALVVLHAPFLDDVMVVNNDLILTSGMALAVYGMLLTQRRVERGAVVACAGFALMLATKVIGIVYAGAGLVVLVLVVWRQARLGRREIRWRAMVLWMLALLLAGSASYGRNWWLYGNPLYPAAIRVGGVEVFPGLYDTQAMARHAWSLSMLQRMLLDGDDLYALQEPVSSILWMGMLVSALFLFLRRDTRTAAVRAAVCLALPALALLLYFLVTPFWREHRLLLPIHVILWVVFAHALASISVTDRHRIGLVVEAVGLLGVAAVAWILWFGPAWPPPVLAILASCLVFWKKRRRRGVASVSPGDEWNGPHRAPWLTPGRAWLLGLATVAILVAASGPLWYPRYRAERNGLRPGAYEMLYAAQGRAWNLVERLTGRQGGKTIAYAGTPIVLPLFGSRLQNQVCYVPVSPEDKPRPIENPTPDAISTLLALARRKTTDEAYWLEGLRRSGVDYLYLCGAQGRERIEPELRMVGHHRDRFELLFHEEAVFLFAVRHGEKAKRK